MNKYIITFCWFLNLFLMQLICALYVIVGTGYGDTLDVIPIDEAAIDPEALKGMLTLKSYKEKLLAEGGAELVSEKYPYSVLFVNGIKIFITIMFFSDGLIIPLDLPSHVPLIHTIMLANFFFGIFLKETNSFFADYIYFT